MTAANPSISAPAEASLRSRIYGFGSVFGKTLRDSRRAIILAALLLGVIFVGVTAAIAGQFSTPESRQEIVALIASLPAILQGLSGPPVNVGTLGGYLQYKYGTFFPIILGIWSIVALSGTLAAEARRGSLEFLAATPHSRRRIALEKLSGHITGLFITLVVTFIAIAIAGSAFAKLPGDEIGLEAAFGYAIWMVLMALAGGSVAFALAPFFGRGSAAGIAAFLTIAGFLLAGYQAPLPALAPLANLTWFGWTINHLPLAGNFDWPSVAFLAVFDVVMLVVGIEAFARRDIGSTSTLPTPSMPGSLVGLGGPTTRTIGFGLGTALAWGLGIGLFGLLVAGSGQEFMNQLANSPDFLKLLQTVFPDVNFLGVGGFLQLLFAQFGIILAGIAAATLVAGWASEETSGRLEVLFSAPLARVRWVLSSGVGMLVNVVVITALAALGIAIGASIVGGEIATPVVGTTVITFYAAALIGIGVAVGGVLGTRWAATVVVLVVILDWMVQLFAQLLSLPEFIKNLALTAHFGQTLVGVWDWSGVVASLVICVGGILIGAWGFKRRDLRR